MNPDYTPQLERLIAVLANRDAIPTWMISIVSVVIGALLTLLLGIWKERHEAKRRMRKLERAICGEVLLNHAALLGTLVTDFDFHRVASTQAPFGGIFSFDALNNAKSQGDILFEVPHFGAMRILYKTYQMMSELHGGGAQAEALAHDGVKAFETLFVQGELNQSAFLQLCETCAPKLRSRLEKLAKKKIKPGE